MFGIGGFANFGVCDTLEVISQTGDAAHGTLTRLSEADIQAAGAHIPSVTVEQSDAAARRGTIVIGHMRKAPNVDELRRYSRTSSGSCRLRSISMVRRFRKASSPTLRIVTT